MRYGNCLIFAALMRLAMGGRIVSEPSRWGWWRHYVWEAPCGRWRAEFNPLDPRHKRCPPPVFRGRVSVAIAGGGGECRDVLRCDATQMLCDLHPQNRLQTRPAKPV